MKRAIFVAVGTVAGLSATLRYTPENPLLTAGTDLALGGAQTLGGSQSVAPTIDNSPTVPAVSASKTAATSVTTQAKPQKAVAGNSSFPAVDNVAGSKPKPTPKKTTKPKPVKTPKPKPKPSATKTVNPKPTQTTTPPTSSVFVTGNVAQAGPYGPVQLKIEVLNGRMTSITALRFPRGELSTFYSNQSIPTLIQEALSAQSANVASAGGASYTSAAFRTSLASAMAQAGLQ
jgi:uncharacterized protein with FMN-binding domain